jgi:hypothetical protein
MKKIFVIAFFALGFTLAANAQTDATGAATATNAGTPKAVAKPTEVRSVETTPAAGTVATTPSHKECAGSGKSCCKAKAGHADATPTQAGSPAQGAVTPVADGKSHEGKKCAGSGKACCKKN